ncbi:MAG: hypothetical protein GF335_01730 [Candidatus Moranbacteria bacterium]|nr:hypothetical protein [Candidatus Moranbacteria bacterium]
MPDSIPISKSIEEFIRVVERQSSQSSKRKSHTLEQKEETDQIAFWYEKIRIAIDYREEHLLRRTASRRILKRLFLLEGRRREVADVLLRELIMGGYVKKSELSEEKFIQIDKALNKYAYVFIKSYQRSFLAHLDMKGLDLRRFFLSIASFEVEEILYPSYERRALINSMYEILAPRINTVQFRISEKQKNLQTYIAIYRSLARADRAMVVSEVFRIYFPGWFNNPSQEEIDLIMKDSDEIIESVRKQAKNALASRIFYAIKKQTLFAHILYEIAMENPRDIEGIVKQDYLLSEFVKEKMEEEYKRVKEKLGRRLRRGLIYIFITKMLIALLIEVPFEKYFLGKIHYTALGVNVLLPPVFMAFLASSARLPKEQNTQAVIEGVQNLVYDNPKIDEIGRINVIPQSYSKISEKILGLIYLLIFGATFGAVIWLLVYLDFNILSAAIFLVFMGTVSFFGALIRQTVRDLVVIKEKEGLISLFFDTMLLPFVRFGRWLSTNFSRVNVFIFLLDVLIEAPFKMVVRLFQSWIDFLKRKREEVDQQFEWD